MLIRHLGKALAATCLLAICAAPAAAQDGGGEYQIVRLSSRTFAFERVGEFTALKCGPEEAGPHCSLFDRMDVSPQIDWDRLVEKARKNAPKKKVRAEDLSAPIATAYAVDRYNGAWRVVLSAGGGQDTPEFLQPFAARILPDFPGYKVTLKADQVAEVEILRDAAQWQAACKELGLDENGRKKKRKGLGRLFE
jgi:hypothetical protein